MTENVVVVGQAENIAPSERGEFGGRTIGPSDALVARFEPGLCGLRAEATTLGISAGVDFDISPPRLGKRVEFSVTGAPPLTRGYVMISPQSGATTILDLLTAQVDLTDAEARLVQARYTTWLALAGLEALLGRRLFDDRVEP